MSSTSPAPRRTVVDYLSEFFYENMPSSYHRLHLLDNKKCDINSDTVIFELDICIADQSEHAQIKKSCSVSIAHYCVPGFYSWQLLICYGEG